MGTQSSLGACIHRRRWEHSLDLERAVHETANVQAGVAQALQDLKAQAQWRRPPGAARRFTQVRGKFPVSHILPMVCHP